MAFWDHIMFRSLVGHGDLRNPSKNIVLLVVSYFFVYPQTSYRTRIYLPLLSKSQVINYPNHMNL